MKNKKVIKLAIIILITIIILGVGFVVIKNLFGGSSNDRLAESSKYKLSNNEKDAVIDKLEEIGNVKNAKVFINKKIIKIIVNLEGDIDSSKVTEVSNQAITLFNKKNLKYFDVEIFVNSDKQDVEPMVGYKHKTNEQFSW